MFYGVLCLVLTFLFRVVLLLFSFFLCLRDHLGVVSNVHSGISFVFSFHGGTHLFVCFGGLEGEKRVSGLWGGQTRRCGLLSSFLLV